MGMSTGGGGGSVKAEPNVTPLVDVMLVLLIIFMVIIPTLTSGLNATPPQGINLKKHPEDDADQLLGIDRQGTYYLNRNPIRHETLYDNLKRIYDARTEDKILYIRADKSLEYAKVQDAVDIAAKAGVRVTGLISEQLPGTEGQNVEEKKGGT
jgi:biopolymer transport protein TolR